MVNQLLSNEILLQLSDVVASRLGLYFPKERLGDLERGINKAIKRFNIASDEEAVQTLLSPNLSKKQLEILASYLTVGETYFFRDTKLFDSLKNQILPALINSKKGSDQRLRIWSAGCCTGEEPYSIAILLKDLIANLDEWNITLLASDINPDFLNKMKTGKYGKWSFRNTNEEIIRKHFTVVADNQFEIHDTIRKMVIPSYLNLAEDVFPSLHNNTNAMDIIICRNVLMYFTPATTERVIRQFHRSMVDNGLLIVSPSETSHTNFSLFSIVDLPGVMLYKKMEKSARQITQIDIPPPVVMHNENPDADIFSDVKINLPQNFIATETGSPILAHTEEETKSASYRKAKEYNKLGLYPEALSEVQEYLKNHIEDSKAYALMSRILANQGKLREAFAWCEKAILLDKLNPYNQYLLATILQEQKRLADALVSLKRAIYLDQRFVLAHLAMGNVSAQLGNKSESLKSFRNAIELLQYYEPHTQLPESDGMTAERLIEIIQSVTA